MKLAGQVQVSVEAIGERHESNTPCVHLNYMVCGFSKYGLHVAKGRKYGARREDQTHYAVVVYLARQTEITWYDEKESHN